MAESNSLALATELRDACTGHPVASIRWPHRLLHRAADEIERLQALENGPAGLADANSKSPAPSSQSERIAVLEAALRGMVQHAHETRGKAVEDAYAAARAALAPLGEE